MTDASFPAGITAVTLFADDLAATRQFYVDVFRLPVYFEDEVSVVFKFGTTLINLLSAPEAVGLIAPAPVGGPDSAPRAQFTITVNDVDAVAALVVDRGATLLNGPMDRPWGIRTAALRDPAGNVWEIAS